MTRKERAIAVNQLLRRQKAAINTTLPKVIETSITSVNGDAAKARAIIGDLGLAAELMTVRPWTHNMVTNPGDLVLDPQETFTYMYTGASPMTHSNQTFYPGAAGVYYWTILPEIYNDYKVYPSINGIIVAVRKNEVWWNKEKTQLFYWKGPDNPTCSWPPITGNEWGVYTPPVSE